MTRIKEIVWAVVEAIVGARPSRLADLCEPSAPKSLDDLNARSRP